MNLVRCSIAGSFRRPPKSCPEARKTRCSTAEWRVGDRRGTNLCTVDFPIATSKIRPVLIAWTYNFGHRCDLDEQSADQSHGRLQQILDLVNFKRMLGRILRSFVHTIEVVAQKMVYVHEESASKILGCLVRSSTLEALLQIPVDLFAVLITNLVNCVDSLTNLNSVKLNSGPGSSRRASLV